MSEQDHFRKDKGTIARRSKIRDPETFSELKRQIDSQAVEIGHRRTGYEQSRREQALLHEELADRERALRDTRFSSIQKLGVTPTLS